MNEPKTAVLYAHRRVSRRVGFEVYFEDIDADPRIVELYPEGDIWSILVSPVYEREGEEGRYSPYWGWWSEGKYSMVWPSKAQFEMCFPYGHKAEEERGTGVAVNLVIAPMHKTMTNRGLVMGETAERARLQAKLDAALGQLAAIREAAGCDGGDSHEDVCILIRNAVGMIGAGLKATAQLAVMRAALIGWEEHRAGCALVGRAALADGAGKPYQDVIAAAKRVVQPLSYHERVLYARVAAIPLKRLREAISRMYNPADSPVTGSLESDVISEEGSDLPEG